jgi:tetratricopeptide (TPR) repeat protein
VKSTYGYQLLQGGNPKDAVEVFKLNVDAYPNSANVYDSLSDGYLELGNKEAALQNAEKAIALLPKDTNITDDLRTLIERAPTGRSSSSRRNRPSRAGFLRHWPSRHNGRTLLCFLRLRHPRRFELGLVGVWAVGLSALPVLA